jgi:hypothetical protein
MMNAARDIPQPIDDPPEDDADRDALPIEPMIADEIADRDRRILLEIIDSLRADTAVVIANLQRENFRLVAEKVERETPNWMTIQRAAYKAGCAYEWARDWAAEAVKAGRSHEATKTAGVGVSVNSTALTAAYRVRHR